MATLPQTALPFPPHPANQFHLPSLLTSSTSLTQLKQIHTQILKTGLDKSNSLLFKLLLSSLSLPSSLDYALSVFTQIPKPETHLCNKLLREFSRSNEPEKTLLVYERMRRVDVGFDRFSLPPILKALCKVNGLIDGLEIHGFALKLSFGSDPFVETGLVRMYASLGRPVEARLVFDKMLHRDVVSWSIMIDGYCQCGLFDKALMLFEEMKNANVEPDEIVLCSVLSACGRAGQLDHGRAVHEFIAENNVVVDSYLASALVVMYASCGSMDAAQELFEDVSPKTLVASTAMLTGYSRLGQVEAARAIFDEMVGKDLVCWSAMISGYAESDSPQKALELFNEMQMQGIKPDQITMLSVISACAHLGALDQAKWIHEFADRNGFGEALPVNNAVMDMYAKCGYLEGAKSVFQRMRRKNVISWTSMINAFAIHGDADNALRFFHQMKAQNIEPNGVTFVGVLYACSHAGLVQEGQEIFASMTAEYNILPKHEHFGCMVDLYGRAKLLREALELIESMPFAPNVVIWGSLMAACRMHGEFELGEFAAKRLLELDPEHDGAHVLLSNIYAKTRKWENVGEVRNLMKSRGILKEKGCSRIELNNEIHEFLMADRSHKQAEEIYEKLDEVVGKLQLIGYAPNTDSVLVDLEEDEKKEVVLWHSEKLALCYALLSEGNRSCIRIVKNLRVCEDCHTFFKLVSKVYDTEIVVRDRTRFHHYKDGSCSCKDYW